MLTVANLHIWLPVGTSVRIGLSFTQVTIRCASVETETGPDMWSGPITLDLRKLKRKINMLRKWDGKNQTKWSDDGNLVGPFHLEDRGTSWRRSIWFWGGVLYVRGMETTKVQYWIR